MLNIDRLLIIGLTAAARDFIGYQRLFALCS
jgi:hypothetical protein